jgi:hypothetical protein
MSFQSLNEGNILLFAMKMYDNPHCKDLVEFHDDINRIIYIKRLLNKYKTSGKLKERLILNHIIVLCNVFGIEGATRLLFYYIDPCHYSAVKTFLIYLSYIKPEDSYKKWGLALDGISMDLNIANTLRKIS